jgi:methylenetetrahydrofolate--tRNA-(uracil-5-)-methyltransferase
MGALYTHVTRPRAAKEAFEPMNINFGLLPPLQGRTPKRDRRRLYSERAVVAFGAWV